MSVLSKIEALIERAAHPDTPVEEARTSAVIAAKLIKEHKLKLVENYAGRTYPSPGGRPSNPFGPTLDEIFDMFFRNRPPVRRPPPSKKKRPKTRRKGPVCDHGVPLGTHCPECEYWVHEQERREKTRRDASRCKHNKPWPLCDLCHGKHGFFHDEQERRTVYTASCPFGVPLSCTCCGGRILPATKMCWVGNELVSIASKFTHESCVAHWSRRFCTVCEKDTLL